MFVSFLRAINVGGKNKIKMADLILLYENLGYKDIKSYLNSGNVVFNADNNDKCILKNNIQNSIKITFNLDIEVIIYASSEIAMLLERFPYKGNGVKNKYITLFDKTLPSNIDSKINKYKKPDDEFLVGLKEIYLFMPDGYGRTKLNNAFFEKISGNKSTTRNLNTITKINNMMVERIIILAENGEYT